MTFGNIVATVGGIALVLGLVLYFGGYLSVGEDGINLDKKALSADADKATDVDPYTKAGRLYTALQYEDALAAYQQAIASNMKHDDVAQARFRVGRCYHKLKKHPQAKAAYKAFIKLHPTDKNAAQANKYIAVL
jgi:tetratricopeptide (TPR) repeat protein